MAAAEQPAETWKAESRRRITALEAHLADLEERLNARGIFSGDPLPYWQAVGRAMDEQRKQLASPDCNGVLLCDSDCPTHGRQHA